MSNNGDLVRALSARLLKENFVNTLHMVSGMSLINIVAITVCSKCGKEQ